MACYCCFLLSILGSRSRSLVVRQFHLTIQFDSIQSQLKRVKEGVEEGVKREEGGGSEFSVSLPLNLMFDQIHLNQWNECIVSLICYCCFFAGLDHIIYSPIT